MNTRNLLATAAVFTALITSHFIYASPASFHAPVNAMFAKEKMVKLSLRNSSTSILELKVGENLVTLAAGQTVTLSLPVGTRIVANSDTSTVKAGTLMTEVSKELSGVVLTMK